MSMYIQVDSWVSTRSLGIVMVRKEVVDYIVDQGADALSMFVEDGDSLQDAQDTVREAIICGEYEDHMQEDIGIAEGTHEEQFAALAVLFGKATIHPIGMCHVGCRRLVDSTNKHGCTKGDDRCCAFCPQVNTCTVICKDIRENNLKLRASCVHQFITRKRTECSVSPWCSGEECNTDKCNCNTLG